MIKQKNDNKILLDNFDSLIKEINIVFANLGFDERQVYRAKQAKESDDGGLNLPNL